ncbi:MAG: response regulator, partial [Crocosphaera sp.]
GLLSHLKSDLVCQHLPVIMLTSRSGDKHRQLAMNLGASAYFSKPFKETNLLATIQQLINHYS